MAKAPGDSGKRNSEQARAKQHKAGCGYREEPTGHEVVVKHDRAPLTKLWNDSHQMHERGKCRH